MRKYKSLNIDGVILEKISNENLWNEIVKSKNNKTQLKKTKSQIKKEQKEQKEFCHTIYRDSKN